MGRPKPRKGLEPATPAVNARVRRLNDPASAMGAERSSTITPAFHHKPSAIAGGALPFYESKGSSRALPLGGGQRCRGGDGVWRPRGRRGNAKLPVRIVTRGGTLRCTGGGRGPTDEEAGAGARSRASPSVELAFRDHRLWLGVEHCWKHGLRLPADATLLRAFRQSARALPGRHHE
jgi:hypothetical protein